MRVMEDIMKMVKLKDATHERLAKHGKFGDSFDDIINRLMDIVDKVERKK